MLAYIFRRILATIPVMAVVALIVFSLIYLDPSDPAAANAGDQATPEDIARIRESMGLNRPFHERFGEWAWGVVRGDLGTSILTKLPVASMIAQRIEPTLSLMLLTLVLAIVIAVPMGVIAAWKRGTWIDTLLMATCRHRLFGTGVRRRLRADLSVRAALGLAAGSGLHAARAGRAAVAREPDPAVVRAGLRLHRADRPHHARDDARSAQPGLHPHRARQRRGAQATSCSCMRSRTRRCRS